MVLDVLKSAEKALADEVFSAMLYERIAMLYDKNTIKQKLIEMAAMEREHAKFWRTFLEKRGRSSPSVKISKIKLFFYTVILKIFGLGLMLRIDPKLLARVIAEEEYGLREEALENPLRAGAYTGMFYAVGAFVPLIPYFLGLPVVIAVILSLLLAGVALGATGFMIAISADLPVKRKMLEMIAFGLGSAGVTYVIGRIASILFGIEVS